MTVLMNKAREEREKQLSTAPEHFKNDRKLCQNVKGIDEPRMFSVKENTHSGIE